MILKNQLQYRSKRYSVNNWYLFFLLKSGIAVFFISFFLVSCDRFVKIDPPINQIISSQVFTSDQTATSAVVGVYSQMMSGSLFFMNGGVTVYPALSADELYHTAPNARIDQFTHNAILNTNNIIQNDIWKSAYQYIYHVNACLEGLKSSNGISSGTQAQLRGELKFTRALCYFYLTNLFGDVPLELSTSYLVNEKMGRTPQEKVYNQIVSDLQEAVKLLSPAYVSENRARPNKWTALSLLSKVYLYQQKWIEAEKAATRVINSGQYKLQSDLSKVFLYESKETIWQLRPVISSFNTAEGSTFIPLSGNIPEYTISSTLYNAFEKNDLRKDKWIDSVSKNGEKYYYPFKYKIKSGSAVTEYNVVLRLSELYLIRSEARARQKNIKGAQEDLNRIRGRAGLPSATASTSTDLINAIVHERRLELFCEWGNRWFDLKRTGRIDSVLRIEKPEWESSDALYPIPFSEIEVNPFLVQNPGY